MIRSPLGLRLNPVQPLKEQMLAAARMGAQGIVAFATGELAPEQLSETGRREVRHLLRSTELKLIALFLPTRQPFDTIDRLPERLQRAEAAFSLAYSLGTDLVLARVGPVPSEATDAPRRSVFLSSLGELGLRADFRGIRLAIETGSEPRTLRAALDGLPPGGLAASIDPTSLLAAGIDPVATTRELGAWVAHAYASDTPTTAVLAANPRGFGFPGGVLDWEEYLGALEEINYPGSLTVLPQPGRDAGPQFTAIAERLKRY